MNCIIYNLRIGCDSKCPGPGHVQLPPVWRVSQYTVTRCHVGCVSHAAVTRCCHTLLSHAAVTLCCHTGESCYCHHRSMYWPQTALGRRDNAQLLRIIHLLNRLSGFISVTCPCVQHLPRDTCPAVSPTLQQMALCCVVHRAWQPHVWAADKAYWYENWNI